MTEYKILTFLKADFYSKNEYDITVPLGNIKLSDICGPINASYLLVMSCVDQPFFLQCMHTMNTDTEMHGGKASIS